MADRVTWGHSLFIVIVIAFKLIYIFYFTI
nr:MAG TPA: hypothetical protein [Caudoviricetes sp.]